MPKDAARHSICRNARRFRPAAKGAPPASDRLGLHAVFTIFAADKPPHGQTPGKPVPHPARIVFVR